MTLFRPGQKYKKVQILSIFALVLCTVAISTYVYADWYSWIERTGAGYSSYWRDVAMSSDGEIMYAVRLDDSDTDYVKKSSDYGATWSGRDSERRWISVATNGDGGQVIAAVNGGYVYLSFDGLASSFNEVSAVGNRLWEQVAISLDSQTMLAAGDSTGLWRSTNNGGSWEEVGSFGASYIKALAISSDGTVMAIAVYGGQIWTSEDSGTSWTARDSSRNWTSIAMSSNGGRMVASANGGDVYISTDSGVTWTATDPEPAGQPWTSVAMSSDGKRVAATVSSNTGTGYIYTSTDVGTTWTQETTPGQKQWGSVAFSSDGARLAAAGSNSYIYTSIDDSEPSAPDMPDLFAESDLGISSTDNLTSDNTPTFTVGADEDPGCENGATVYIRDDTQGDLASGTCVGGVASITLESALADGSYEIRAKQIDSAGNESGVSSNFTMVIETDPPGAPDAPDMTADTDTGSSSEDNITNDTSPTFSSNCNVSDDYTLILYSYVQGEIASAVCTNDPYTIGSGELELLEGDHTITTKFRDIYGNLSPDSPSLSITIDTNPTSPPGFAPDMTADTDSGSSNTDNITNDTTPIFTGSCTTGYTVYLYADGNLSNSDTCLDGSYLIESGTVLASGSHSITSKHSDTAGNLSDASDALSVTIDTTAPVFSSVTPATSATINSVTSSSDVVYTISEALGSGSVTATRTSGTVDASSPHTCTLKGTALASGAHTLNFSDTTNGCTSDVSNLVSGTVYTFVFAGSDVAGNFATSITRTGVTFDNTAPTITSISSDKAAGSYKAGEVIDIDVTFSETVTSTGNVTVTLETGDTDRTCTFSVSGATTGTCNYTVQAGDTSSDLTASSVSGTIADAAGNAMSNFTPTTNLADNEALIIDTTAPVISEVTAVTTPTSDASPDYTFTTSEAGIISYGGSCTSVTTSASSGSNTITLDTLSDGTYSDCTITVSDAPGNTSNTLTLTSFTVSTVVASNSSGSSGSRGGGIIFGFYSQGPSTGTSTLVDQFLGSIINLIPNFSSPEGQEEAPVEATISTKEPLPGLAGEWDLIPGEVVDEFVLEALPSEIANLISKFPELGKVFISIGVRNIGDLSKLQDVTFNLPKIADRANPPTEIVFTKTGEGEIPVSTSFNVKDGGTIEQVIHILGNKPMILEIKPDGKAESVKGYLTFKRRKEVSVMSVPENSMFASALMALGSVGEKAQASVVGPELLIFEFEYTDSDRDGIYTADIQTPQVEGEYEVITIIDYADKKQGVKEIRMVTVIDPDGYIYEKDAQDREIRVKDAKVSIYEVRSGQEDLWDAKKYSQDNPQITDKTGRYAFLVPEGTYYITVESDGYNIYRSELFDVRDGNPVHKNIELVRTHAWLGYLLDWKTILLLLVLAIYITHIIERRIMLK